MTTVSEAEGPATPADPLDCGWREALAADPLDYVTVLAYCDWLEERAGVTGDKRLSLRAEWHRLSVELSATPEFVNKQGGGRGPNPRFTEVRHRLRAIQADPYSGLPVDYITPWVDWFADGHVGGLSVDPHGMGGAYARVVCRYGFVTTVRFANATLDLSQYATAAAQHPRAETVVLEFEPYSFREIPYKLTAVPSYAARAFPRTTMALLVRRERSYVHLNNTRRVGAAVREAINAIPPAVKPESVLLGRDLYYAVDAVGGLDGIDMCMKVSLQ